MRERGRREREGGCTGFSRCDMRGYSGGELPTRAVCAGRACERELNERAQDIIFIAVARISGAPCGSGSSVPVFSGKRFFLFPSHESRSKVPCGSFVRSTRCIRIVVAQSCRVVHVGVVHWNGCVGMVVVDCGNCITSWVQNKTVSSDMKQIHLLFLKDKNKQQKTMF